MAEARNADFYRLWVDLTHAWPDPLPKIEFRIYPVANSADAMAVVFVEGARLDGTEVNWGLSVTTRSDRLVIEGSIGVRTLADDGSEAFTRSAETQDPQQAADLIRAIASEVCARRQWLT
jgi:hypothetical protein